MSAHTHRILIGANDWRHPQWLAGFYPDDLPEDWQLGYYSNEFPVVLLPADAWPTVKDEIEEWLADSHDELLLLCEVPVRLLRLSAAEAIAGITVFIQELSVLGAHCLGLLLSVDEQCADITTILTRLNSPLPLCLDLAATLSDEQVKSIQKVCEQQGLGVCWRGQGDAGGLGHGPVALTRIDSRGMTMRGLRQIVETILNTTTLEQSSLLILDGRPPDLEMMRNANVILDLI